MPKSTSNDPKYNLISTVREGHEQPIYSVAFSRHVHAVGVGNDNVGDSDAKVACFATCGGPYATIYEVISNNSSASASCSASRGNDRKSGSGSSSSSSSSDDNGQQQQRHHQQPPLTARQIYRDVDDGETFYTCAFGGRGVGSPVGYSALGNVEKDERGNTVINFGSEKKKQQQQQQHCGSPTKRPAKRQRQQGNTNALEHTSKAKDAAPTIDSKQQTQFILPNSNTQNGPPLLCLGGLRGVIKVIDTVRQSLFLTLSGHGNDITDLKFSPTNEWLLLSASKDDSIRLWNLTTGVNVAVYTGHNGHRGQVLSVSWHLSGRKFASCGMDNMVKLWNVMDDDGPVETALRLSYDVKPDELGGDGQSGGGHPQEVVQTTRKFRTVFQQFPYFSTNKAHTNYVDCVQFIGDLVLSKSVSNKVVLWKPILENEDGTKVGTYTKECVPSAILFLREFTLEHCDSWYIRFDSPSPYHKLLALGNEKGEVKVWRIGEDDDGEDDSGCHPNQKYCCSLSTSGGNGASSSSSASMNSTVRMVAFNPLGTQLVAVKDDSTVWVWDAA